MYKEYVVTAANLENTDSIWDDLVKDGFTSETIPERSVEVADERPINKKNTTYLLTKEEAGLLKQDPRVIDVFDISEFAIAKSAFQEGNFNKNTTTTGEKQNWGLLRHILETNTFGTSVDDPGGSSSAVIFRADRRHCHRARQAGGNPGIPDQIRHYRQSGVYQQTGRRQHPGRRSSAWAGPASAAGQNNHGQ